MIRSNPNTRQGFTLNELLIVVVIFGILAAIAIPNFIAMQNHQKEGLTKANMHAVQLIVENYWFQYDKYPMPDQTQAIKDSLPPDFKNPFTGVPKDIEIRSGFPKEEDEFPRGKVVVYTDREDDYLIYGGNERDRPFTTLILMSAQ